MGIDETDIGKLVALQAHGRAFVADGGAGASSMSELVELLQADSLGASSAWAITTPYDNPAQGLL